MGSAKRGKAMAATKKSRKKRENKSKRMAAKDAVLQYLEERHFSGGNFEFHCHSSFSDGLLPPQKLVERAFHKGVKVLALTDHDTLAGVPQAIVAARRFGMRIIPGVEISARFRNSAGQFGETVHVLAYYGCCGPAEALENKLVQIREGRYVRARAMVEKLHKLKMPLKWEDVLEEVGPGVAPGRPHIARALVKAGHVSGEGEAFKKYIGDDGPAYATGCELAADEAVGLIIDTGGIAVLAHPWSLKSPIEVIEQLKNAGLHAMESYKADGKDAVFAPWADAEGLVKLGGSDFHGTGASHEKEVGTVEVPVQAVHQFLKLAEGAWAVSTQQIISSFAQGNLPSGDDSGFLYGDVEFSKVGNSTSLRLSSWLTDAEMMAVANQAESLKLEHRIEVGDKTRNMIVTLRNL